MFKIMLTRRNWPALYLYLHRRLISSTTRIVLKNDLPAPAYKPEIVERNKYKKWEAQGRFKAEAATGKQTFSMVLPPPNVTGKLHLGHALACTVQDVIIRRKRSMGVNVAWIPGTDHAGIATQGVVEKYLKSKQNLTRHELGREKFIREILKWREKHGNTIIEQLKNLGCSLDWSRQTFTMDPQHTHAVNTAFIRLFQKGLIYRKKALVNWCNSLKSTISDIEVDNIAVNGPTDINIPGYDKPVTFGLLYEFAYMVITDNSIKPEEIVVSTTMPETMLGDTAIAVHPEDERYHHLIGKQAFHPFRNAALPIIADKFVDMKFGTGAVKITPAHSKIDQIIAKKHNLPLHEIITEDGLIQNSGNFNDLKKYDCRTLILDKLETFGLLRKITPHTMTLPICSRSGNVIDYLPKEQWFLKCSELNKKAATLVKTGQLKIEPDKFVDHWLNWAESDRDWCISRQLWWGHQIPAYKCQAGENTVWVAANDVKSAKEQASKVVCSMPDDITALRDSDVLDTWFSSGIYPFAVLGWPDKKFTAKTHQDDFESFYPLSLMATGHDILGFWVHRMVILGLELTGKLPFSNVLLHGIICDNKGAKMSKSRGNVIDPIDVINGITMQGLKEKSEKMHDSGILNREELEKALAYHKSNFSNTNGIPQCGVDAMRFTLLSQDIKSHFISFDVAMCNANKLFCNKIWQSIKYTQIQFAKINIIEDEITRDNLTDFDRWILSRLADMVNIVNRSMDEYSFHLATKALRTLIYNEFCDVYLEATKVGFENDVMTGYAHAHTLSTVLNTSLRCLAPFMVYLTDELIPKIPTFEKSIIYNFKDSSDMYFDFPKYEDFEEWNNLETENCIQRVLSSVQLVRELKGLYNINNQIRPTICVKTKDQTLLENLVKNKNIFTHLTRSNDIKFDVDSNKKYATGILNDDTEIFVEIKGVNAEDAISSAKSKIEKKVKKLEEALLKMETKLVSDYYTTPEWIQILEKEKFEGKKKELERLQKLAPYKI